MKSLPKKLQIYLVTLYIITPLSIYYLLSSKYVEPKLADFKDILFFAVLAGLTETLTVAFRGFSFSTTFAITIAAYILFGPIAASLVTALGFTLRVVKVNDRCIHIFNTPIYKTLFNYCNFLLPIIFGNYFYYCTGGNIPVNRILGNITQISIFIIVNFILNILIISILISTITNKNLLFIVADNIRLGILNFLIMAPFGFILAFIFKSYKYFGVLLFIFPIILARYTFSLYIEAKSKYVQTVDSLMRAVEARDKYTQGHSQRVAKLSETIARALGYNDWKIEQLNIAALLHDVGKIGIDDHILNKPGKLTEYEYNIIKSHPEIGCSILENISGFKYITNIVKYHHERFDGKGYPEGKRPEELSLDVFIVQLADSIDAMMTDRPYRRALTEEQVIDEIRENKGTQFHPVVVDAYLKTLGNVD